MKSVSTQILGEVIASSTTEFRAQARELNEPPEFGSFVKVGPSSSKGIVSPDPFDGLAISGTLYAVVYEASTGSIEANRRPAAYGLAEDALRTQQPQIFELLVTDFSCLIVGHVKDGRIRSFLP